ncbi:cell division protein FtsL [Phaeovulum sp.]|uniref:cell division protein FtsL n=1 Tax=Phaeovulum sp. TaxID=2934796 RepID=UPI0039E70663
MRSLIYLATALAVMGLAFWAYRENYRTQSALGEMKTLQRDIASLREGLSVLKAEWAYLNRPDRLRELANLNFERLALLPLQPSQFGAVAQVAYPPAPMPLLLEPVDTIGAIPETQP